MVEVGVAAQALLVDVAAFAAQIVDAVVVDAVKFEPAVEVLRAVAEEEQIAVVAGVEAGRDAALAEVVQRVGRVQRFGRRGVERLEQTPLGLCPEAEVARVAEADLADRQPVVERRAADGGEVEQRHLEDAGGHVVGPEDRPVLPRPHEHAAGVEAVIGRGEAAGAEFRRRGLVVAQRELAQDVGAERDGLAEARLAGVQHRLGQHRAAGVEVVEQLPRLQPLLAAVEVAAAALAGRVGHAHVALQVRAADDVGDARRVQRAQVGVEALDFGENDRPLRPQLDQVALGRALHQEHAAAGDDRELAVVGGRGRQLGGAEPDRRDGRGGGRRPGGGGGGRRPRPRGGRGGRRVLGRARRGGGRRDRAQRQCPPVGRRVRLVAGRAGRHLEPHAAVQHEVGRQLLSQLARLGRLDHAVAGVAQQHDLDARAALAGELLQPNHGVFRPQRRLAGGEDDVAAEQQDVGPAVLPARRRVGPDAQPVRRRPQRVGGLCGLRRLRRRVGGQLRRHGQRQGDNANGGRQVAAKAAG